MKPTIQFVKERFDRFNRLIFGGRLAEIPILLCDATSFVGQFKSKMRKSEAGVQEHYDSILRISRAFDLSERELEDTIIHEMIHYFIAFNGLIDRPAHGPLFKALMQSINENHSRNITISQRCTPGMLEDARTAKKKWHVIAIIHFTSGVIGVKVLPRIASKIISYHKSLTAASNVSIVNLYLHNDAFFNRFPTSVGRRCHTVTQEDLDLHLKGAYILEVKNGRLIQR